MNYKNSNGYNNKKMTNIQQGLTYKPSLFGKIALCFAVPAAIIGILSIFLALILSSMSGEFFLVCIVAELIAFVGGVFIVIDIVRYNNKTRKEMEKSGLIPKKEKDIANLIHFFVGLGLGILLSYFLWGFN